MSSKSFTLKVGVLALQGAFTEHVQHLRKACQIISREYDELFHYQIVTVRSAVELERCDGLIIPGGESSAIRLGAGSDPCILAALNKFIGDGRLVFGTCAGLIILAKFIEQPNEPSFLSALDVVVCRNFFGRQAQSFTQALDIRLPGLNGQDADEVLENFRGIFIRAPAITRLSLPVTQGKGPVSVLASVPAETLNHTGHDSDGLVRSAFPVAVLQDNVFATCFHPELTSDTRIHEWWLRRVLNRVRPTLYP